MPTIAEKWINQGVRRQGLLEAIQLGLEHRFGEKGKSSPHLSSEFLSSEFLAYYFK